MILFPCFNKFENFRVNGSRLGADTGEFIRPRWELDEQVS
jgi:hypothetical protein